MRTTLPRPTSGPRVLPFFSSLGISYYVLNPSAIWLVWSVMGFYTVGTEDNIFLWLVQEKLSGGLSKSVDRNIRVVRRSCGGQVGRQGTVVMRLDVVGPKSSILNSGFPVTYLRFLGSQLLKRHFKSEQLKYLLSQRIQPVAWSFQITSLLDLVPFCFYCVIFNWDMKAKVLLYQRTQ